MSPARARKRITSGQWWQATHDHVDKVLRFYVQKAIAAEAAELRDAGAPHECGHRWEISIRSSMHAGIVSEGPAGHEDADWWSEHRPVTIRAHSLRAALIRAVMLPITAWFEDEEPTP